MQIECLLINNFRCFGPADTIVNLQDDVTALVGSNGAGKTAILMALARMFGVTSKQRSIRKQDFHVPLDQVDPPEIASFSIECLIGFPELDDEDSSDAEHAVPEYFQQMAASGPGKPLKVRMRLQAAWTDDGTPDGTIEEDIRWLILWTLSTGILARKFKQLIDPASN